jgi:RNA 3'-terminal phosphate cyclase-like protein
MLYSKRPTGGAEVEPTSRKLGDVALTAQVFFRIFFGIFFFFAISMASKASLVRFQGCKFLRQRLILSTLSNRPVRIDGIRSDDDDPGLRGKSVAFVPHPSTAGSWTNLVRASGLAQTTRQTFCGSWKSSPTAPRLKSRRRVRKLGVHPDGAALNMASLTRLSLLAGTSLRYRPGVIVGGVIQHDCGTSRAIGWWLEALILLAPFAKLPVALTLTGITNDAVDKSVSFSSLSAFRWMPIKRLAHFSPCTC